MTSLTLPLQFNRPARTRPTLNFGSAPQRKVFDLPGISRQIQTEPDDVQQAFKELMSRSGTVTIRGMAYKTDVRDLEHIGELGSGACGQVVQMRHQPSNEIIAVKQMQRSRDENKRIIMDLEVVMKSHDCPYIVKCLGCFITDSFVWICMEQMETCLDKVLKRSKRPVPEDVIGKIAVATVKALQYLKEKSIIHRDVKPSNILLDRKGNVKLCDFGISGYLVNSVAQTRGAGCIAYMAPERFEPPKGSGSSYDIRSDVWSLGITLVELATGKYPYEGCTCDFELMSTIMSDKAPRLPSNQTFTPEFRSFVAACLKKDYKYRPNYKELLNHPFIKMSELKTIRKKTWLDVIGTRPSSFRVPESDRMFDSGFKSSSFISVTETSNETGGPPAKRRASGINFSRRISEQEFNARRASIAGPLTWLTPAVPQSRLSGGSDGLRTPTLTPSSTASSPCIESSSKMSVSAMNPCPVRPRAPPPRKRRLWTLLLCF